MKTLRNKVILSAVVLAFALIATIGSTYAWFTVSQTATVESMTLNVTAADSLLVKVYKSGETAASEDVLNTALYKTTITNDDLTAIGFYEDLLDYQLQPVTSVKDDYSGTDAKVLNYLTDLTTVSRPLSSAESFVNSTTTGKFIELNFWVYSQADVSTPKDLVVNSFTVSASNTDAEKDAVADAVRLAVWSTSGSAYIFGNDIDFGFTFVDGLPGYSASGNATPTNTDFNALADTSYTITDNTGTVAVTPIVALVSETPTLVTVRIYVEGWDADVTNAVISSAFNITFQFGMVDHV